MQLSDFFFNGLKQFEYQNQFHHEKTRKPVCYIVVISKNSTKKDFEEFFNQQCLQLNQTIHSLENFKNRSRMATILSTNPVCGKYGSIFFLHLFSTVIRQFILKVEASCREDVSKLSIVHCYVELYTALFLIPREERIILRYNTKHAEVIQVFVQFCRTFQLVSSFPGS